MKACPLCREAFSPLAPFFAYGELEVCPSCHHVLDATAEELEEAGILLRGVSVTIARHQVLIHAQIGASQ
jgi:uncharacterized protein YbaR (Trm112 family)